MGSRSGIDHLDHRGGTQSKSGRSPGDYHVGSKGRGCRVPVARVAHMVAALSIHRPLAYKPLYLRAVTML